MRMIFRRAGVAAAAMASIFGLGGQAAEAAPSADIRTYGYTCVQSQVIRCAWFKVDHTRNVLTAHSDVTDRRGERDYSVATSLVRLQRYIAGRGWVSLPTTQGTDYDGWHPTRDTATGRELSCTNGGRYTLRSVAFYQWNGGSEWRAGRGVTISC